MQDLSSKQGSEKKELHDLVFRTLEVVTAFKAHNQEVLGSLEKHARDLI